MRVSRSGGDQPHQIAGKMRMSVASQKLGVARPKIAKERPRSRPRCLLDGGVNPDGHSDQQSDEDRHQTQLDGDQQAAADQPSHGSRLQQGLAEITMQQDSSIQRAYCTYTGTSSPSRRSSSARSILPVAVFSILYKRRSTASPGMKRTERNTRMVTRKKSGSATGPAG